MKYLSLALATAGLLVTTAGAYAISFAPVAPLGEGGAQAETAKKFTVGLSGATWDLPTLVDQGFKAQFSSDLRPLVTAEYQATPRISVGGWVNFLSWEVTGTDLATGASAKANVDGNMFEVHGTYALPQGYAAQLGYQRWSADMSIGGVNLGTVTDDFVTLWGLKTFDLQKNAEKNKLGIMLGLGVQQELQSPNFLQGNALVGASWGFSKNYSADVSAWFNDFTRSASVTRYTFGVTGRF